MSLCPNGAATGHAGEAESSALLKEINKQKGIRPLTHDCAKNIIAAVGHRVTRIRITELVGAVPWPAAVHEL